MVCCLYEFMYILENAELTLLKPLFFLPHLFWEESILSFHGDEKYM